MKSIITYSYTLNSDEIKQAMLEYFTLNYSLKIPANHSITFDVDSNDEADFVEIVYKQEG